MSFLESVIDFFCLVGMSSVEEGKVLGHWRAETSFKGGPLPACISSHPGGSWFLASSACLLPPQQCLSQVLRGASVKGHLVKEDVLGSSLFSEPGRGLHQVAHHSFLGENVEAVLHSIY